VEIRLQVVFPKRALVGTEQPPLHERRYPVNAGEQFMALHPRAFHWRGIVRVIGTRVGREPVSDEGRAGFNVVQEKGPRVTGSGLDFCQL